MGRLWVSLNAQQSRPDTRGQTPTVCLPKGAMPVKVRPTRAAAPPSRPYRLAYLETDRLI